MASIIDDCRQEMEQTVGAFKRDLARLRTSRASTTLLEGIVVEYYGARTPLNQLASISAPEPIRLSAGHVPWAASARPHSFVRDFVFARMPFGSRATIGPDAGGASSPSTNAVPCRATAGSRATGPLDCAWAPAAADSASAAPASAAGRISRAAPSAPPASGR